MHKDCHDFDVATIRNQLVALNDQASRKISEYAGRLSPKWEYLKCGDIDNNKLNELGRQGWELISTTSYEIGGTYRTVHTDFVFKRPIPSDFSDEINELLGEIEELSTKLVKMNDSVRNPDKPPVFPIPDKYKFDQLPSSKQEIIMKKSMQENLNTALSLIQNKEVHYAIATLQVIVEKSPSDSMVYREAHKLLTAIFNRD